MSSSRARRLELLDRRGTVDVRRHEVRRPPALGPQPACELRGAGRLSRAVQADQHEDDRARATEVERDGLLAERPHELAMHELHEMLLGREAREDVGAECVLLHGVDEVANDGDVHVRFKERETDVAQRLLDVPLGDLALSPQLAQQGVELLAE
jgi:hypothetical protein